jgi:signal transduction histidine kinase
LDQLEVSRRLEPTLTRLGKNSSVAKQAADLRFRATSVPPKVSVNRPRQLLELAGKLTRAAWGGIGLLAEGDLVEHLTFGISDQSATELVQSPWFIPLIDLIQKHPGPVTLKDLRGSGLGWDAEKAAPSHDVTISRLHDPTISLGCGLPPLGSFLGIPLNSPGLYQGALYLARCPELAPFDATDEATVLSICGWLEQWRVFDETHLLNRLRLLTHVAQAAAGSLDLERILTVALRELDRHLPLQIGAVWLCAEDEPDAPGSEAPKGATPRGGAVVAWWGREEETPPHDLTTPPPHHLTTPPPGDRVCLDPAVRSLVLAASSAPFGENASALTLEVGSRLWIEETPFATCLSEGQAVYADLRRPVESHSKLAEKLAQGGATAFFAAPLRAGDRTVGVLQSVCMRPSGFTNEQIQLLYLVADLLGPAISNCRLYDRLSAAYEQLRRTQTHLIQAEKMRALGELAAGMAHDFNNSLCAVLGFLELTLLDSELPAGCRRYLESSRTCALDAAQTVHRVQDFARWRRSEMTVELVDPNALVRQTLELSRHKWDRLAVAGTARITVEQYTEATARVSGNSAELREVLTNLVFNAVDAMPQGGSLVVRTWSTASDVFLSVQDTGVGITDSVRRRLFEPFFTTKGEQGNGMGLSVSFGIVQRHNGEIWVDSVPSCGSTFTVRLPAVPDTTVAEQAPVIEQIPTRSSKNLRILIVEDEESIRRFLAAGLVQLGHRPRLTSNAQEALAAFVEEPFDVVLTDLGLPGSSGEEVARQVAELSPNVPVVLLTGWADQIKAETKPVPGVKCILGKPVSLSTLASTLEMLHRSP